jgi:DNA ligase-1
MTFKPMLAVNAVIPKIQYPIFASPKLDGIRAAVVDGRLLSRTLKPIPNKYISECLSQHSMTGMDGELIVGEPTSKTCYTDSVSSVMAFDKIPHFTYYVFDLHNIKSAFSSRRLDLLAKATSLVSTPYICILEQNLIHNESDLLAYEAAKIEEGYEGVIIRSPDAFYKYGRSTVNEGSLIKLKRFEDSEAEIIGFEEEMFNGNEAQTNELGRTKRSTAQAGLVGKNTLGAFLVRDVHTGVEFSIGTGLTALERQSHWLNRDSSIGGILKYKFFPVGMKDKPRHPVFLGFRHKEDM